MTESRQQITADPYNDKINLREIFSVLWARKVFIGGFTLMVAVVVVAITLLLPDIYRAEALLAPNEKDAAGGLSALAAQYGGLASLAGIDIGGQSSDKTALGLETLRSRKFITEFVNRHDVLVPLMAARDWDRNTGALEIDSGDYDVKADRWVRRVSPPRKAIPSMQEAHEKFMEILSVTQNKTSGFITVSVEHYSPEIAKQWLDWLIEDLNLSMMRKDVAEAEQAISYLKQQVESTSLADLQSVFFRLIEDQTKTIMLARVTDEYVFKTIDPAVVPDIRARPMRLLIVIFSSLFGLFFAVGLVLVSSSLSKQGPGL